MNAGNIAALITASTAFIGAVGGLVALFVHKSGPSHKVPIVPTAPGNPPVPTVPTAPTAMPSSPGLGALPTSGSTP
jgi:hypothetical protein